MDSGSWWWTEWPGMLWFMGSQRVGHYWVTKLKLLYNIVVVLPYIYMNQPWVDMYSPSWTPLLFPSPSLPLGHPSVPGLSTLSHAPNLDWWSISHVIHMFQCCSLKSSHPCLLPQSPKVCSLHLCLSCCLTYRIIVTIFLSFIYVR